jgi:hypothetical protein
MNFGTSRFWTTLALAGASIVLITCGKNTPSPVTPSSPAPVTTIPAPPTTTLPFGLTASCAKIGYGDPTGSCRKDSPSYLGQLDSAIDRVVAKHPEYFDLDDVLGAGGYHIKTLGLFYVALLDELDKAGICAGYDGEEIQIKDSQALHDQYKVLAPGEHIRRGVGVYRASCYPAGMPLPVAQPGQAAGCKLPGSRSIACGTEGTRYFNDVDSAIDELYRTRPELFNFNDHQKGTDWPLVNDVAGYENALVGILNKRGFCAIAGEELGIKKGNELSETYDILTGTFHVRRGEGSYGVTCYPADF